MRLSVFTVVTPDLTPEELGAAAREAGVEGIEWRYKDVPADALEEEPSFWRNNRCSIPEQGGPDVCERFKRAADGHGLISVSVTPYLKCGDLEGTERVLATARQIGAGMIRLGVAGYDRSRPFGELYEEQRRYLAEAEVLCRQYGVKGLVETHHMTIAPSASAARRLVDSCNPDWIGVLCDPGNMVREGYENYKMGLELLGPYLAHVHMKNGSWTQSGTDEKGAAIWNAAWVPMKQGMVSWPQLLEDLKAVGYDGWLGIEDFSKERGTRDMLKQWASYIGGLL
ncbi:sugar phosphate isomerase/epimerase [Paenibacillus sp. YYML68]|uniref:sugar phosphate isomerase/epimerase family protein n=1 Tax=Paenibacillus sp. YYML68 TaxID=2909250 RepID=UPI002490029B|nr:sugar phosphate isomerase/epimerase family protein [Paenibacillus sp. YYML68]